jgi:hypothetical protein
MGLHLLLPGSTFPSRLLGWDTFNTEFNPDGYFKVQNPAEELDNELHLALCVRPSLCQQFYSAS